MIIRVAFLIFAWVFLSAQTPMLPGFPPGTFQNRAAIDGAVPVTFAITFGSSQEDATSQASYSIANVGFGSADTNRYAVASICIRSGSAVSTPTVTIGGAATTMVIEQNVSNSYSALFKTNSVFPSGTTATVAISSFGSAAARAAVQGYSVVTSTGAAPSGGAISTFTAGTTTTSGTVTVPANGGSIIANCSSANMTTVTATAPASGITVDKQAVIGASTTTTVSAHDTVTRTGSTTYTLTSSGGTWNLSNSAGVVGAWAP